MCSRNASNKWQMEVPKCTGVCWGLQANNYHTWSGVQCIIPAFKGQIHAERAMKGIQTIQLPSLVMRLLCSGARVCTFIAGKQQTVSCNTACFKYFN
jgi:hypothetical protein